MGKYILGIDQSTTTTKAILFDREAHVVARADVGHKQIAPRPGWVEHNPEEIWTNLVQAIRNVLDKSGADPSEVAAISVTNQRETTMLWTPAGKPAMNAVVWQCSRGESIVKRPEIAKEAAYVTEATGLMLSGYFSAAKAAWIHEHTEEKELLFGTMDSWVIFKLTGNHVTDYSNASRTQLFNINTLCWDEKLLALFGLTNLKMPRVCFSDEIYGYTTVEGLFPNPIPVAGDMGDSHGALFAQQCWQPGMGKCTFGTGGSIMMNIGYTPNPSHNRLNTSIAWGLNRKVEYVYEGTIVCMGDTIKWLINELGLIANSAQSEEFATKVTSSEGVYLVPAFVGLGAPHWNSEARALICGLHRYANKYHIVRAGVESITYQIRDIVEPMLRDANMTLSDLRLDGGPTHNKFLMQFTADLLGAEMIVSEVEELSALGAAYAGGLAVGFWKNREEIAATRTPVATYRPVMEKAEADELYAGWQNAVSMLSK